METWLVSVSIKGKITKPLFMLHATVTVKKYAGQTQHMEVFLNLSPEVRCPLSSAGTQEPACHS